MIRRIMNRWTIFLLYGAIFCALLMLTTRALLLSSTVRIRESSNVSSNQFFQLLSAIEPQFDHKYNLFIYISKPSTNEIFDENEEEEDDRQVFMDVLFDIGFFSLYAIDFLVEYVSRYCIFLYKCLKLFLVRWCIAYANYIQLIWPNVHRVSFKSGRYWLLNLQWILYF